MRISYDPRKDERNRRKHGYPLPLAALLFARSGWVDFADDRPLGYELEARRVALGEVDGRVLVCVFTEHEDGEEMVRHIISLRDATRGEADAFHRQAVGASARGPRGFRDAASPRRRGDRGRGGR